MHLILLLAMVVCWVASGYFIAKIMVHRAIRKVMSKTHQMIEDLSDGNDQKSSEEIINQFKIQGRLDLTGELLNLI